MRTASSVDLDRNVATAVELPVRKAMAVGLGNALEFYDFMIFSYFAIQIGRVFFPESQTSNGQYSAGLSFWYLPSRSSTLRAMAAGRSCPACECRNRSRRAAHAVGRTARL